MEHLARISAKVQPFVGIYPMIPEPEVLTLSNLSDLSDVVRSTIAFALSKEDDVELSVIAIRPIVHAL